MSCGHINPKGNLELCGSGLGLRVSTNSGLGFRG